MVVGQQTVSDMLYTFALGRPVEIRVFLRVQSFRETQPILLYEGNLNTVGSLDV